MFPISQQWFFRKCLSKDSFLFEAKLHILQANGFSPVCVKIWRDIQEGCFMTFWHTGHWYCPSSRMMGTIICNNISNILNLFFKNKKLLRLIVHNKEVRKTQRLLFFTLPFLIMNILDMCLQHFFPIWGIITKITSPGLFSSVKQDMTGCLVFVYHYSLTYRTLCSPILKNYWFNLQDEITNSFLASSKFF